MNATTVAVDLAKNVFQLAVADANWRVVKKHRLTRAQFERFFVNREASLVVTRRTRTPVPALYDAAIDPRRGTAHLDRDGRGHQRAGPSLQGCPTLCRMVRTDPVWLMAGLSYGGGLRLMECLRLRVKDIDFDRGELTIRDGKGQKDRVTLLPRALLDPLRTHLSRVRHLHNRDLAEGYGRVYLPFALDRKYPNADREWGWQYVFPAARRSIDPRARLKRRHHASPDVLHVLTRGSRGVVSPLEVSLSPTLPNR